MKKQILFSLLVFTTISTAIAGNYKETMLSNIETLNQTQNTEELIQLTNTFDRIAQKETEQWLPLYYSSYANVSVLFFDRALSNEAKNNYLDKAQQKLDEARKITDLESEIAVLQALIYQMRITDPSLGQKYSILSNAALAKAITLNSENPRAYYLKGNNVFHTPKQFGGGKTKAKALFEKAASLFSSEGNRNQLMPSWGNVHNNMMLKQCQ
jgi:hypothetical protein